MEVVSKTGELHIILSRPTRRTARRDTAKMPLAATTPELVLDDCGLSRTEQCGIAIVLRRM